MPKSASLIVFALLAFISGESNAAPHLQNVRTLDGAKVFQDHQDPTLFYYLRIDRQLARKNDQPHFRFDVNRYFGSGRTGDRDNFHVRGVIRLQTVSAGSDNGLGSLRDMLRHETGKTVTLKPAPVADAYHKLVYATIADDGQNSAQGEIAGGHSSEIETDPETELEAGMESDTETGLEEPLALHYGASKQRYTIALGKHDSELFWKSFQQENLLLTLAFGWTVKGVIKDINDQWKPSEYLVSNTLGVDVWPKGYPELFKLNELWQDLSIAHSQLTVACYDFINSEDSDLFKVLFKVRLKTLRDQDYAEKLVFKELDDAYEQLIEFKQASDLSQGYEYQIKRTFKSSASETTAWVTATSASLDISLSDEQLAAWTETADGDTDVDKSGETQP